MSLFDDISKDWKEQKGWPSDLDTDSITDKNKNVMKNLIEIERKEKAELRLGLVLGGVGVIAMVLTGIVYPVMQGAIVLNPFIIIGASIVAAALIAFLWASKRVAFKFDESKMSKDYLKDAKEKIKSIGSKQGKLGITYTIQLLAGMCLLVYGILSQFPETSSFWHYLMPIGFGALGLIIWKIRHNKKAIATYEPMIKEIDDMLENF